MPTGAGGTEFEVIFFGRTSPTINVARRYVRRITSPSFLAAASANGVAAEMPISAVPATTAFFDSKPDFTSSVDNSRFRFLKKSSLCGMRNGAAVHQSATGKAKINLPL